MTTYNTQNPLGSADPRDLYDNAENADRLINGAENSYPDRLGNERLSWAGIEDRFQEFLLNSGYEDIGPYAAGLEITGRNQIFVRNGEYYRAGPSLDLPYTTTGDWATEGGSFVSVGDAALRQELAADGGALIHVNTSTGEQSLADALDGRVNKGAVGEESITTPAGTDTVATKLQGLEDRVQSPVAGSDINALSDISTAYALQSAPLQTERTGGILQTPGRYYHFGIMDMLPDGSLIIGYRNGDTHIDQGDDGALVYSKVVGGGIQPPTVIAAEPGVDVRAATGGVLPNGRIVFATNIVQTASYPPAVWDDVRFYASDDSGETWFLADTITATQSNYKIPYGKGKRIGDTFVIPYYERDPSNGNIKARLFETTDGLTWIEGATIIDSAVDYNEFEVESLGGGVVVAMSRIGGGGAFRQFLSTDEGATWADSGDTVFAGEEGDTLVSPALTTFTNASGKQFLLIVYANRTVSQMRYRYKAVSDIVAGDTEWKTHGVPFYSAPTLSGYPSIVKRNGVIHVCFFRETQLETESTVALAQISTGDVPDYDSGYFSVLPSSLYTQNHGLGRKPMRVEILFSTTDSGGQDHFVYPGYFNDGANKGVGAEYAANSSEIKIATGHALFGAGYFSNLGFGTRLTAGYYRVRAWL